MLRLYIDLTLAFIVIIYAAICVMKENIIANGWMVLSKKKKTPLEGFLTLVFAAAIPVFREAMILTVFYMAMNKIEDTPLDPNKHT